MYDMLYVGELDLEADVDLNAGHVVIPLERDCPSCYLGTVYNGETEEACSACGGTGREVNENGTKLLNFLTRYGGLLCSQK